MREDEKQNAAVKKLHWLPPFCVELRLLPHHSLPFGLIDVAKAAVASQA
jgi:hypothetical protein